MELSDLRETIPALETGVYCNWGASGPSPRRVVEAAQDELASHEYDAPIGDGQYPAAFAAYDEARDAVAGLLGADPAEIALTESTTDSINRVVAAFDWSPGDVVVRTDCEHAAVVLPFQRLEREHGVEVRVLETDRGRLDRSAIEPAVDDARLVCVSSLTWTYGTRLPIADVVDTAHDAGAMVLVDAVQSVGQVPIDVAEWGAEFVAGAGHKWLCGPFGSGFLFVDDTIVGDCRPAAVGYRTVVDETADPYEFLPDARRFEVATSTPAAHAGLTETIELVESVGSETIADRIAELTRRFVDGVPDDRLLSPRQPESGLVTVAVDDPEATVDRLAERDIVVRSIPDPEAIRVSIHAVNTDAEIDAVLDAVQR